MTIKSTLHDGRDGRGDHSDHSAHSDRDDHGGAPGATPAADGGPAGGSDARAAWWKQGERSNATIMRLMTWLSLRLGRRGGRVLLALIVGYFLAFAPLARRASRDYLARALGRPARWRDVARHLFTFAATIHDRIYLLNGRFDLFDIRVEGTADITAALADGRGAFLMGAHCGSFEVVRAIGRRQARGQTAQRQRDDGIPPMRVAITMFDEHAQQLQAVLAAVNPEVRQDIVALGTPDAMLKVREYLDRNFLVGMLADRSLPRKDGASAAERDMWRTPFLGAPANFPTGPMRMAAMLRRPVIFMTGLYRGGNRYDIRFETIADFSVTPAGQREAALRAAQSRYVALLESRCRAAPHNWFNFYDFWRETDVSAPPR